MSDDPTPTPDSERLTLQRLEQLIKAAVSFSDVNYLPLGYVSEVDFTRATHSLLIARAAHSLAAALNRLDEGATKGLLFDERDGLRRLRALLDDWVTRKEWQRVIEPGGETYIKECENIHEQEVRRPFLEAVRSYVEGRSVRGEDIRDKHRDYARLAERSGYQPTVPYIEDESIMQGLYERFQNAPVIGAAPPGLTEEEHDPRLTEEEHDRLRRAVELIADGIKRRRRRLEATDQKNSLTITGRAGTMPAGDREDTSPVAEPPQYLPAEGDGRAKGRQGEGPPGKAPAASGTAGVRSTTRGATPPKASRNEDRDEWLYTQYLAGVPHKKTLAELREIHSKKGWSIISTPESVRMAVKRLAHRKGLPPPVHGHQPPAST